MKMNKEGSEKDTNIKTKHVKKKATSQAIASFLARYLDKDQEVIRQQLEELETEFEGTKKTEKCSICGEYIVRYETKEKS